MGTTRSLRRLWFALPALLLVPAAACKTASPPGNSTQDAAVSAAPTQDASPAEVARPVWSVDGSQFAPRSAALLWRAKANDAMLIVSDSESVCDAVTAGAWPRGMTMLRVLLKHNARELRDAAFDKAVYPLRKPDSTRATRAPRDAKSAALVVLDDTCSPRKTLKPTTGSVTLRGPAAAVGHTIGVTLDLSFGKDRLAGRLDAVVCPQPKKWPRGCK